MESKLDILLRRNKGKNMENKYFQMFLQAGFKIDELNHIDLKRSDEILNKVRDIFPKIEDEEIEILSCESSYLDSKLLNLILLTRKSGYSYIYSDDVNYCGMYFVKNESTLKHCLNVAKTGYSNTCFILDKDLEFSFRINFYLSPTEELSNQFDIKLKSLI